MAVVPSRAKPATVRAARRADELTVRRRSPTGARSTGASTCTRSRSTARSSTTSTSARATVPPIVFVHGLGGCWQNWLENLPRAALDRRAIALDLPGFGLVRDAARRDLDPGLRPHGRPLLRAARARRRSCWSGTRWAASSQPRWRSGARSGSSGWCSCPRPASRSQPPPAARAHLGPGRGGPRRLRCREHPGHDRPAAPAPHRACRRGPPPHAPAPGHLLGDDERRRPQPRLHGRAERAPRLRLPRPPRRDRRAPR